MPTKSFDVIINAGRAGCMDDRLDFGQHGAGMLREGRNLDMSHLTWARRKGWKRANVVGMPWNRAIGFYAYRDTMRVLHGLVVGDDGHIYHSTGDLTTWTVVTLHDTLGWDETYNAEFAEWRDDCFITVNRPAQLTALPGATDQNIRFDGLSGEAFGVGVPAPATALTAADGGAGNIAPAVLNYIVTFLDVETGWQSPASPVGTVTLTRPAAPAKSVVLADGGAGLMAAATYDYAITYYEPATGWESVMSYAMEIVQDALHQVDITDIQVCPAAGVWQRRIYRQTSGGGFFLVHTLADNVTTVWTDNGVADGAAYAVLNRHVHLTNIPLWAGAGRTVHRCIYRDDDGAGYNLLVTIENNTAVAYADNIATPVGAAFVEQVRIPPMGHVAVRPDGRTLWGDNREGVESARIYSGWDAAYPEAQGETLQAGSHSDPITGLYSVRDAVLCFKRRSIYLVPRECDICERLLEKVGCVAWATIQNIGTSVPFLSPEGPRVLTHYSESDVRFVGRTAERFCLAETWENVVKARLPYAGSVHIPAASLIVWFVQMCAHWPLTVGDHNDTAIIWDYGAVSAENPGGNVKILDLTGLDHACLVPVSGSEADQPWGAFALGYVGQLFEGYHGDGTNANLTGTVQGVSGTTVTVDPDDLEGENVLGSILYIRRGTGTRVCRAVEACENARALIISQCGGNLGLAGALSIDETSQYWIGGFTQAVDLMVTGGDLDKIKTYNRIDLQVKGALA